MSILTSFVGKYCCNLHLLSNLDNYKDVMYHVP